MCLENKTKRYLVYFLITRKQQIQSKFWFPVKLKIYDYVSDHAVPTIRHRIMSILVLSIKEERNYMKNYLFCRELYRPLSLLLELLEDERRFLDLDRDLVLRLLLFLEIKTLYCHQKLLFREYTLTYRCPN